MFYVDGLASIDVNAASDGADGKDRSFARCLTIWLESRPAALKSEFIDSIHRPFAPSFAPIDTLFTLIERNAENLIFLRARRLQRMPLMALFLLRFVCVLESNESVIEVRREANKSERMMIRTKDGEATKLGKLNNA